jgi:hypothetical protein
MNEMMRSEKKGKRDREDGEQGKKDEDERDPWRYLCRSLRPLLLKGHAKWIATLQSDLEGRARLSAEQAHGGSLATERSDQ